MKEMMMINNDKNVQDKKETLMSCYTLIRKFPKTDSNVIII